MTKGLNNSKVSMGTSEQVSFFMTWHLRNPVATGKVESLPVSDPGLFRSSHGVPPYPIHPKTWVRLTISSLVVIGV